MSNISKGKDSYSALTSRLLASCVLLPVCLALIAILSTTLSADIQHQFVMGVPVILWFWLSVAFFVCLMTVVFALKMSNLMTDTDNDNINHETRHETRHEMRGDNND